MSGAPVALLVLMLWWAIPTEQGALSNPGPLWICFNLAVLASAVMLICRWFLLGDPGSAWSAAGLLCIGTYLQPLLAADAISWSPPLSAVDLAAMAVVIAMLRAGVSEVPTVGWRQPLLCGVGAGLALAGLRGVWDLLGPVLPPWAGFALVASAFPPAAAVCASTAPHALHTMPRMRGSVFVVLNLVGIFAYHVLPRMPVPAPWTSLTVATTVAVASSLLIVLSAQLLHDAFRAHARRLVQLTDRASQAETAVHYGEELLHEFRATIAGIDSATRLLLLSSARMSTAHRESLQRMLEAELARLQQMALAQGTEVTRIEKVDLDRVLEPLVVAQRSQGALIEAPHTGLTATCCALEFSKAVHVLLCNARVHAPGARIRIGLEETEDTVVVRVQDDGPGVPPEVRSTLFARRAKGGSSGGEGLGLHAARKSLHLQGGDLLLEPTTAGASFAMVLPR